MRHAKKNKILGRNAAQLRALRKSLLRSFFLHERIKTTEAKAKLIKPEVERMITASKKNTLAVRRAIIAKTGDRIVAQKILTTIGPRYAARPGGYTRIIKIGQRRGDAARQVYLVLI